MEAKAVWQEYLKSGKHHLFITGDRKSGKTTLLRQLTELLNGGQEFSGITTWAEPGKAVYMRENGTAGQVRIGVFDPLSNGKENRMRPDEEGFRNSGTMLLRKLMDVESEWISIDEIGYLESECSEYKEQLYRLLCQKPVIAVVRKQNLAFLNDLLARDDAFVVELSETRLL